MGTMTMRYSDRNELILLNLLTERASTGKAHSTDGSSHASKCSPRAAENFSKRFSLFKCKNLAITFVARLGTMPSIYKSSKQTDDLYW